MSKPAGKAAAIPESVSRTLIQIGLIVLVLGLWELGVRLGWISAFLFGSPLGIAAYSVKAIADGSLLYDTWVTVFEATLGFVLGTLAGSVLGLSLWYSPFIARTVEPIVVAFNSVPKIAFAPIIILWFGTGLTSKVALAISLTSIVALIAAYQAAKDADPDLQGLMVTLGANKHNIFYSVIVPSSTTGRNPSCCARLKRWISSTNSRVARPSRRRARAASKILRRSATPENTADKGSKCRSVASARSRAIVVLPQPGGPHRIREESFFAASMRPSGPSGPSR